MERHRNSKSITAGLISVLMIDDDVKLTALTKQYVEPFSIDLETVDRPSLGLAALKSRGHQAVVLDLMLPEMDGFQVLKRIREFSKVPVIMLTARGELTDRVVGLELGADDYLAKPFEPRELVARLQALVRRASVDSRPATSPKLKSGALLLDRSLREAWMSDKALQLTTSEFAALELLMSKAGESLDRDQIMEALRGIEWDATNRVIDITMSRLRQKLGDDPKTPHFIKTVWGTGYAFIAPVQIGD
jgi:two-component system phosphate regulon response regulator OmpR